MTTSPTMQSLVQMYLEERRSAGFALEVPGKLLMGFACFSDRRGHRGPITEQLILDWVQGCARRATPFTWARRLQTIRPFARFCFQLDRATYVPEQSIFGRAKRRLTPHIYTDREVADLLRAAGQLTPEGALRPATYKTLFGLIAATGLRLSEALKLLFADLDFRRGVLTVRQTKFAKSRSIVSVCHISTGRDSSESEISLLCRLHWKSVGEDNRALDLPATSETTGMEGPRLSPFPSHS